MKRTHILFLLGAFLLAAGILWGCGAGGGGVSAGTGTVAVLLTDGLTDEFSSVLVTITSIELLSDNGHVTVFSGVKTIDLLDLRDEFLLVALEEVPAGLYSKIRLRVSDVVLLDGEGNPITDPPVKLPGNGKLDLNPQGPFFVHSGELLTIKLDMDMEKSLKIDENPNFFIFRPVVFIDVIDGVPPEGRVVRVEGEVRNIDAVDMTFELCPTGLDDFNNNNNNNDDSAICLLVKVSGDTSFFASDPEGGPVPFEALQEGDHVTVIGKFMALLDAMDLDDNGHHGFALAAIVVEIGEFLNLEGTIVSQVDVDGRFEFLVDADQEVTVADVVVAAADSPLLVQLQEGTRIFSSEGDELGPGAIEIGRAAEIDGKLVLSDTGPDVLNAAFILIQAPTPPAEELSGEITGTDDATRTFDLLTDSGTACVEALPDAVILRIREIDNGGTLTSEVIGFEELQVGDMADVFGHGDTGCFQAEVIVVFDEFTDG